MQQGSYCPGTLWAQALTTSILSHLVEQLPVGALASSKSQMIPQLLHSQTGPETNSHSHGWKAVRKLFRWKPVQLKENHIMLYDGTGNFIKNKISKQKEQQCKEKFLAILPPEEMLSKPWPQHEAFSKTNPCFTMAWTTTPHYTEVAKHLTCCNLDCHPPAQSNMLEKQHQGEGNRDCCRIAIFTLKNTEHLKITIFTFLDVKKAAGIIILVYCTKTFLDFISCPKFLLAEITRHGFFRGFKLWSQNHHCIPW